MKVYMSLDLASEFLPFDPRRDQGQDHLCDHTHTHARTLARTHAHTCTHTQESLKVHLWLVLGPIFILEGEYKLVGSPLHI